MLSLNNYYMPVAVIWPRLYLLTPIQNDIFLIIPCKIICIQNLGSAHISRLLYIYMIVAIVMSEGKNALNK